MSGQVLDVINWNSGTGTSLVRALQIVHCTSPQVVPRNHKIMSTSITNQDRFLISGKYIEQTICFQISKSM
jgi:hypothetical protein